ncbi:MAG: BatD family protein [Puniceicoccales bacterium]|jgi:hypothetical protein|nr:BatD family protein [Puniceicoccales bacterium]
MLLRKKYFQWCYILFLCSQSLGNTNIVFEATFHPSTIHLGEHATWMVTAKNVIVRQVNFPQPVVNSLRLKYESGTFNTQIINGVSQQSTLWRFSAFPQSTGTFRIPEISIDIQGQTYAIPTTTLTVLPPDNRTQQSITGTSTPIFLRLEHKMPDTWYLGQSCPMEIQLLIAENVRGQLTNLPQKNGDTFAATHLTDAPEKTYKSIQGTNYQCISWATLVTPLKSGPQTLSFNLDLMIEQSSVLNQKPDEEDDNDLLSFFNRSFSGVFSQPKAITVDTSPLKVVVQPLPTPQPQPFHQAIGYFQLASPRIEEKEAIQDEPITFQVTLQGSGNFERIQEPTLIFDTSEWRTYLPKSNFEPSDKLGFTGKMYYEYLIVPMKSGEVELPIVHFCYFDTTTQSYIHLKKAYPFKLNVKPPIKSSQVKTLSSEVKPSPEPSMPLFGKIVLQNICWENPQWLWQRRGFYPLQWILFLTSLGLSFIGVRYHRRTYDKEYQLKMQHKHLYKETERALKQAFDARDVTAFYSCAYKIVSLTILLKCKQQHVSVNEIDDLVTQLANLGIQLPNEQLQYLQSLEQKYRQSQFGQFNNEQCPDSLQDLKDLLRAIK